MIFYINKYYFIFLNFKIFKFKFFIIFLNKINSFKLFNINQNNYNFNIKQIFKINKIYFKWKTKF